MVSNTKIILVSGLPGVGKTTFSKILSQKLSFKYINVGECIKVYLEMKGHDINENNKSEWGKIILNKYGEEKVYEVINNYLENGDGNIIDGVRLYSTYLMFCRNYVDVQNILVKADEDVRKNRLSNRIPGKQIGVDHNQHFFESAYLQDYDLLLSKADVVLNNSNDLLFIIDEIEIYIKRNFK